MTNFVNLAKEHKISKIQKTNYDIILENSNTKNH